MNDNIDTLYADHFDRLKALADEALDAAGFDELLIFSGEPQLHFRDDHGPNFIANPQLKAWLPVGDVPYCWLRYRPGDEPQLIYPQPADYWHLPPADPKGAWTDHVNVNVTSDAQTLRELVGGANGRLAILGELDADEAPSGSTVNPEILVSHLDYYRGFKSDYEIACMKRASVLGAHGHEAARAAFESGASEFEIHMRYCEAVGQREKELPYNNIIGLNTHAAVLHYQTLDTEIPAEHLSFLIDAGANFRGYASDITRTYGANGTDFAAMIDSMNEAQQRLCEGARSGVDYADLNNEAHREIGALLNAFDIVNLDAEACVDTGITRTFLPHGLGHLLGIQVHDVGGFQAGVDGDLIERPEGHPALRLTRTLEPRHVLTIEPGLYFIDMLLEELAESDQGKHVNWERVEALKPYGGIRIEDNVVVNDNGAPRNLTREAFQQVTG